MESINKSQFESLIEELKISTINKKITVNFSDIETIHDYNSTDDVFIINDDIEISPIDIKLDETTKLLNIVKNTQEYKRIKNIKNYNLFT